MSTASSRLWRPDSSRAGKLGKEAGGADKPADISQKNAVSDTGVWSRGMILHLQLYSVGLKGSLVRIRYPPVLFALRGGLRLVFGLWIPLVGLFWLLTLVCDLTSPMIPPPRLCSSYPNVYPGIRERWLAQECPGLLALLAKWLKWLAARSAATLNLLPSATAHCPTCSQLPQVAYPSH